MIFKPWNQDDEVTEIRANRRLFRKERRDERRQQYADKNGDVIKYLPQGSGYLVTSGGEVLAELRE